MDTPMLPSGAERSVLEQLADHIESVARERITPNTISQTDDAFKSVTVRDELMALAWDIKCMARYGTTSYGQ
jgi:hypothetical protein